LAAEGRNIWVVCREVAYRMYMIKAAATIKTTVNFQKIVNYWTGKPNGKYDKH